MLYSYVYTKEKYSVMLHSKYFTKHQNLKFHLNKGFGRIFFVFFCFSEEVRGHLESQGLIFQRFGAIEYYIMNTIFKCKYSFFEGFPGGSVAKYLPAKAGDSGGMGLIPGLRRSLGAWNSNPLQYSCQKNSMDREAWQATVHRVTKSWPWQHDRFWLHFTVKVEH